MGGSRQYLPLWVDLVSLTDMPFFSNHFATNDRQLSVCSVGERTPLLLIHWQRHVGQSCVLAIMGCTTASTSVSVCHLLFIFWCCDENTMTEAALGWVSLFRLTIQGMRVHLGWEAQQLVSDLAAGSWELKSSTLSRKQRVIWHGMAKGL